MPVADVIAAYTLDVSPRFTEKPKQMRDFTKRMGALLDFWGDKVVSDINKKSCGTFAERHAASTARRYLEDLRAAVELAIADEAMEDTRINFKLPPAPLARYRFYTRGQVAKLVWESFRKKGSYSFTGKRAKAEKRGATKATAARPTRHIARFLLAAVYTGTRTERIEQASYIKEEGRPWIDLENGIFYRSWDGERVPDNKRADPIRIPLRLLAHMRRWHKNGARYLIEWNGKPVGTSSAFFRLLKRVIPNDAERAGLNKHSCKHTCATWAMQAGVKNYSTIAGYLSIDEKTLKKHYGHHHPDFQGEIDDAFTSGSAGRIRSRRDKDKAAAGAADNALTAERRRALVDVIDATNGPLELVPIIEKTPGTDLSMLRERILRAARSGDWSGLVPDLVAAE
ncbi:integrase [Mesorhizobium sp. B2-2-2]|uniref:integrase n=1 Tax=Mesorhizobium sp. B2-2-2 TaxID=2589964 RepID=UPI0015E441B3|nr:integrase [Mesorhizobium sp. B2-2-2]